MDTLHKIFGPVAGRTGSVRLVMAATGFIIVAAACGSTVTDSSDSGSTDGSSAAPAAARSEDAAPNFDIGAFANENFERGQPIGLDAFLDKPVVVNFWFPSCPPCRLEMPHFEAAFQTHKDDVAFIGIQQLGLDSEEEGQDFVDEFGLTYAIGPDGTGTIIRDYQVIAFPTTLFLNEDHEIVKKWSGPLNEEKLNELIGDLLAAS
jgi:thiol-disulfide isomerase/thioredoxin